MAITFRRSLGTALTYDQLDDNFLDYTTFRDKFEQTQWIGSNDGKFLFYNNATGKVELKALDTADLSGGFSSNFSNLLATKTLDDLAEGTTNKFYSSTLANADFDTRLATKTTTNLPEGSNKYYTDARVDARIGALNTGSLPEGSNLYYTNARADGRIASASLTSLVDVDNASSSDDGKILYYDHSSATFKWKADSFTATLTALTDVATVSAGDNGKVLYYDHPSTSFKWQIDPQKAFNVTSTNSTTLTAGEQYGFNTNGSPLTTSLPSTASLGQSILIVDAGHYFGTNNLTVDRNGNTINGGTANLVLGANGQSVGFLWNGSGWVTYLNTSIYG
tara:strand:+ start:22602 stop:23606 length:1005 start_codon:yes stop_codon:yes gene_type:complete